MLPLQFFFIAIYEFCVILGMMGTPSITVYLNKWWVSVFSALCVSGVCLPGREVRLNHTSQQQT